MFRSGSLVLRWFFALSAFFVLFLLLSLCPIPLAFSSPQVLQDVAVSVRYDEGQEMAAQEVLRLHGKAAAALQKLIPWSVRFHTTYLLLKEGALEQMTGSGRIVALAIPAQNLVLLDLSKMARHAFALETTMKHELCHLLLHAHIREPLLPKWLDEGVCQWGSNGVAEIIMEPKVSSLEQAVLARRLMPLDSLVSRFPADDRLMLLAYEESESVVKHIEREYGTPKLLTLLDALRQGRSVADAAQQAFGITLAQLEDRWKRSLATEHTWLTYVSMHIYEILFFVAALLAIVGCVKLVLRRKHKRMEADEVDSP